MRLRFLDDGTVQVRTGKVELGQGILTALTQIAADALGLRPDQIQMLAADTRDGPDEGVTSGSLSVQDGGAALRRACIEACAARQGGGDVHPEAGHRRVVTRQAVRPRAGLEFAEDFDPQGHVDRHTSVGISLPRIDLPAKLAGQPSFIHDLAPAGLLHGRVLHPPSRDAQPVSADLRGAEAGAGVVCVHRDGRLFGVVAERGAQADVALQRLKLGVQWHVPALSTPRDAAGSAAGTASVQPPRSSEFGRPANIQVARTLKARYRKPWIAHASLAPSCALARWDDGRLQVWSHSQGIFNLRRDLALAFDIEAEAVRVQHVEGAGCYGHNGADDVAFDAAWLARQAPGRPVRVLWSRADELSLAPFGPAMTVELEADLDGAGQVLHWRHHVFSPGHSSRPGRSATPALLGRWQTATPLAEPVPINMPLAHGGGAERNAAPGYAFPGWQVFSHRVSDAPLRSSALRSLGAFANVFAAESFVDEIAHATGDEPLAWRLRHMVQDARALAVLRWVAERAGWVQRLADDPARTRHEGVGFGLAFARYKGSGAWCAVVAEVEAGASLRGRHLTIAVDVGEVINPDGVSAQIEGGAIQATSWALKEAVGHEGAQVNSTSWGSYPILRFSEVPAVEVLLMPSTAPSLGAGEAALGPTAAAIANALFDALGVRVRELPLTRERIIAAMDVASD